LQELIHELEQEVVRLGYCKSTLTFYKNTWEMLADFAAETGVSHFSEKLGLDFLEKRFNILSKDVDGSLVAQDVKRLRAIRILGDFQLHGVIFKRHRNSITLLCHESFIQALAGFNQFCVEQDYSPKTIDQYTKKVARFLVFAEAQRILSCCDITLPLLHNYIKTLAGYAYKTIEFALCAMKCFVFFLYIKKLVGTDYSKKLPKIQYRKQTRIPSVWSEDEIAKLISAIDRGSPIGKRDYAIILLACRLGIRVGDIIKLKYADFHWANREIVFTQSKTTTEISLPLPTEVGWAVIDYLKYGRPNVECPYVFLCHNAPFLPFSSNSNLYHIVGKYIQRAHIHISPPRKRGMHSLRHTLASLLLECDTPLPVISDILGHADSESTAVYLKIDIKKLKECALDFEEGAADE